MTLLAAWCAVAVTLLCTVYSQVIVKHQVLQAGEFGGDLGDKARFIVQILINPWVISAMISTFVAAVSWIAAMTRLPLSVAYPALSLTFAMVLLAGAVFFDEPMTWSRVAGVGMIMAGLVVANLS